MSSSPLRILLVEPRLVDNGALRVSFDRAARWVRDGAEVTVLVVERPRGNRPPLAVPDGLCIVYGEIPQDGRAFSLPGVRRVLRSLASRLSPALAMLRGLAQGLRADVIVGGREIGKGMLLAERLARWLRRPYAVTIQSNIEAAVAHYVPEDLRAATRDALRRADLTVAVSRGAADALVPFGVGAERLHVVTNGADVAAIRQRAAEPPSISLPEAPFVVAVGHLTPAKHYDLLIRAHARAVRNGAQPHHLLILGEGGERERLEALADTLGVRASVQMPGFVANPHAIVARADLFVLSSRWEGFSLALVEALSLGTPIVATDCVAGPSEILRGGAYGRLVPPDDAEALARAISAHLDAPEGLAARAAAGAAAAAERFDLDRAARRHLDLLESLVRQTAPRRVPVLAARRPASAGVV